MTDGGGGNSNGTAPPDFVQPTLSVQGGSAPSPGGQGAPGGTVHFVAAGGLSLDPSLSAPAAPIAPTAPGDAMSLSMSALAADVNVSGSVVIAGSLASGGTDPLRQITASGDIYVSGSLRAADLGGMRQGLTLRAESGTIYVTGAVDSSGAGAGQAGGSLTIIGQRVVVSGKLISSGATGASAGPVTITATQGMFLTGPLTAQGGDAKAAAPSSGGRGGNLKLQSGGEILLGGVVSVRGGSGNSTASDARGGDAGAVTVDGSGTLTFSGTLDGRGGLATASSAGGQVVGGAASTLRVGEGTAPQGIAVLIPVLLTGGDGAAVGGVGGSVTLEPHGGNLRLAGTLDASGGSSAGKPGAGGPVNGNPGPDAVNAGVEVAGQVISNGGSISAGGKGDGAGGGTIKLVVLSTAGDMTVEANGQVQSDGGKSAGPGQSGAGGLMFLFTNDGNADITGKLFARGGDAPDASGKGGPGGLIYVFTDNNHGGKQGGALVIETAGIVDASGGSGSVGGDARSDNQAGSVATFPANQDDEYDVEQIAVLINSDGLHGTATGYIDNEGTIIARGGKSNGAGGDVVFHGKRLDGNETPLLGNGDMSGDGTGAAGDYAGE